MQQLGMTQNINFSTVLLCEKLFFYSMNNSAKNNIIAIAAGESFSLALRADRRVVCWGSIFNENEFEFELIYQFYGNAQDMLLPDKDVFNIASGKQHFSLMVNELNPPKITQNLDDKITVKLSFEDDSEFGFII